MTVRVVAWRVVLGALWLMSAAVVFLALDLYT